MTDPLSPYYQGTREIKEKSYAVLDAKKLFDDHANYVAHPDEATAFRQAFAPHLKMAARQAMVVVWHPEKGNMVTISDGVTSVTRPAKGNEIIFIKKVTDDKDAPSLKVYEPSDSKGPLTPETLAEKYHEEQDYVPKDRMSDAAMQAIPEALRDSAKVGFRTAKALSIPILHEVITKPTVVVGARDGVDQMMGDKDSLKFEDGECLPLQKKEIAAAWRVSARGTDELGAG